MEVQPIAPAMTMDEVGGFGTFQPTRLTDAAEEEEEEEEEDEDAPESSEYVTREQLKKRLSKEGKYSYCCSLFQDSFTWKLSLGVKIFLY